MIRLHGNMDMALWDTGRSLSVYAAFATDNMQTLGKNDLTAKDILQELGDVAVSQIYISNKLTDYLGKKYLDTSPIVGGIAGMNLWESKIITEDDCIDIMVTYNAKAPISLPGFGNIHMGNRFYAHLWNGYNVCGQDIKNEESKIVFVSDDSEVYHTTPSCSYLYLTVKSVLVSDLTDERNNKREKYYPCSVCAINTNNTIAFICEDGNKYHFSRSCYCLKRQFEAVSLASVSETHRPCGRCGNQ